MGTDISTPFGIYLYKYALEYAVTVILVSGRALASTNVEICEQAIY